MIGKIAKYWLINKDNNYILIIADGDLQKKSIDIILYPTDNSINLQNSSFNNATSININTFLSKRKSYNSLSNNKFSLIK